MFKTLNTKLHTPLWLFVLLIIVLILKIPSLFMPYSYGDEMIYLILGNAIRQGVHLYSGVHDNKPPLLYVVAAIAGNLFWFKAILAFWSLTTVYIFWKLTEILLPKNLRGQQIATIIFALLTTIPLLEGNIANAEMFMVGPSIMAFYLLLRSKPGNKSVFAAGLLFSIAALFKIPAAFEIPAIVFYWICIQKSFNKKTVLKILHRTILLTLGFILPIALTFVWYYLQGAFKEYLIAAYLQNFGYLSSFRPGDVQKPFLVKNGPLLIRAAIVALAGMVLFWKRKHISKQFLFISFWTFLTLFAVTLSERPYPHYLIQSLAPVSLLVAILVTSVRMEQVYSIIPLFFVFVVPFYYHFWHYETLSYYQRFVRLMTRQITLSQYLDSFGGTVQRNYKIASYLTSLTKPDERVFIWGDGVSIYALSRRLPPIKYVADYHIKDFSSDQEVIDNLKINMPLFIVVLPESDAFPELSSFLHYNYGQTENIDNAQIWRLLGPKVRSALTY